MGGLLRVQHRRPERNNRFERFCGCHAQPTDANALLQDGTRKCITCCWHVASVGTVRR